MPKVTDLNYLLLGLLARQSQTAYSLTQSLASTPMRAYSSSPGSVYPAVRKLVDLGWVEEGPAPPSAPGRRPRTLAITQAGREELEQWLLQPITADELTRRPGTVVLRLSLVSGVLGEGHLPRRLDELEREARAASQRMASFVSEHPELPLGSRLPLDLAVTLLETYADWAEGAVRDLD